jgi:hypothetical protein
MKSWPCSFAQFVVRYAISSLPCLLNAFLSVQRDRALIMKVARLSLLIHSFLAFPPVFQLSNAVDDPSPSSFFTFTRPFTDEPPSSLFSPELVPSSFPTKSLTAPSTVLFGTKGKVISCRGIRSGVTMS